MAGTADSLTGMTERKAKAEVDPFASLRMTKLFCLG
jgi:hypothetical protein